VLDDRSAPPQLLEEADGPAGAVATFPGRLTDVDICHDDWCRIYQGGYCNCDPEIHLRPPPEHN
jgi:hypothetical protein